MQAPALPPIVLSVDDVAQLLRCSADTVQASARDGTLPGVQFGRDWVFPVAALAEALNTQATRQAADRRAPQAAAPAAVLTASAPTPPRTRASISRRQPPRLVDVRVGGGG